MRRRESDDPRVRLRWVVWILLALVVAFAAGSFTTRQTDDERLRERVANAEQRIADEAKARLASVRAIQRELCQGQVSSRRFLVSFYEDSSRRTERRADSLAGSDDPAVQLNARLLHQDARAQTATARQFRAAPACVRSFPSLKGG